MSIAGIVEFQKLLTELLALGVGEPIAAGPIFGTCNRASSELFRLLFLAFHASELRTNYQPRQRVENFAGNLKQVGLAG